MRDAACDLESATMLTVDELPELDIASAHAALCEKYVRSADAAFADWCGETEVLDQRFVSEAAIALSTDWVTTDSLLSVRYGRLATLFDSVSKCATAA